MSGNSKKPNWMSRMSRMLRVTCEDTTPLISELMDHNLPLGKRLRLRIHLGMCGVCKIYEKQLEVIRALSQKLGGDDAPTQKDAALSDQAKIKIKETLKQSN
ncbi:MAG: zf-HC2 domain-containing protein [Nitrospinota bacterium]|nr:zf-HC2 domain-containing protein [Nitrospinota bacterium]